METSTDPRPDQAPPTADPEFHPAAALFPLMDVDGAKLGQLHNGQGFHRGEATP